jgi:hypothetical protein
MRHLRVLAKVHYAKSNGYDMMHYIFDPFEIFHYLPKVNTDMYLEPMFKLTMDLMFHSKRSSEPLELYATECVDSMNEEGAVTAGHVVLFKAEDLPPTVNLPLLESSRLKDLVMPYSEIKPYLRSLNLF